MYKLFVYRWYYNGAKQVKGLTLYEKMVECFIYVVFGRVFNWKGDD
jgi:hypothetical protein